MKCKLNPKTRAIILNKLRRLSYMSNGYKEAKDRCKVAPNLFQCEACSKLIYAGSSNKNFEKFVEEYEDRTIVKGKLKLDHQNPVIDPKTGYQDLQVYAERMFIDADGYNGLCDECHNEKSKEENKIRRESKK